MKVLIGWVITCLGWSYLGAEILALLYDGQPMLIGAVDTIDMSLPLLSDTVAPLSLADDFATAPEGTIRQILHYLNAVPMALLLISVGWLLRRKTKPSRKDFSMRRAS